MNASNLTDKWYPPEYRIISTCLYVLFMFVGLVGNLLVITVVFRVRGMRTPTNCYLVSLAVSDCIFFLSAMPREIMALHQPMNVYVFGEIACATLTYLPYLAINSSSLSITAFTVERYIAICEPMKAQSVCTVRRAVVIIAFIWIFSFIWNASWLYLATLEPHPLYSQKFMCSFRIKRDSTSYKVVYMVDFVCFYCIPLVLYLVLYGRIGHILMSSTEACRRPTIARRDGASHLLSSGATHGAVVKGRTQVVKMLVVIVCVFAVCWLPYRALVFYNSFASKPWINDWFLLFAKIMIVINCAINPILYNLMSAKFRSAFGSFLRGFCEPKSEVLAYNRSHLSVRRTLEIQSSPMKSHTQNLLIKCSRNNSMPHVIENSV